MENLEYHIHARCCHQYLLTLPSALKQLKLYYDEQMDVTAVQSALRPLSRLIKLAVYNNGRCNSLPNGGEWQTLIGSSLILLKSFQFCFPFIRCYRTLNDVKRAVATFSTPFYRLEKCWFIQCDCDCHSYPTGILYSLPFAFSRMPINIMSIDTSISTLVGNDKDDAKYQSYEKVTTLLFNAKCPMPDHRFHTFNISRLILNGTFSISWIPVLTNLQTLEIQGSNLISPRDFAQLLTKAVQLRRLTLPASELETLTERFQNKSVCNQLSERIQTLTFAILNNNKSALDVVNATLLSPLVRIFGQKCEHLSFALALHPDMVLPLLHRLEQLRSLCIQYDPRFCRSRNIVTSLIQEPSITRSTQLDFMHITDENCYCVWFGNRL